MRTRHATPRQTPRSMAGYTVIELILALTLATIIIGFSVSLIQSASTSYARDRRLSRMVTDGQTGISSISQDIANTGLKYALDPATKSIHRTPFCTIGENGIPTIDSTASFIYKAGDPADTLIIYMSELSDSGTLVAISQVHYTLSGTSMSRTAMTRAGSWTNPATETIIENVDALQFQFSADGMVWVDNPTGIRNTIKSIRIALLIRSTHANKRQASPAYLLGDVVVAPPADGHFRRVYQETVEILNNGVL